MYISPIFSKIMLLAALAVITICVIQSAKPDEASQLSLKEILAQKASLDQSSTVNNPNNSATPHTIPTVSSNNSTVLNESAQSGRIHIPHPQLSSPLR